MLFEPGDLLSLFAANPISLAATVPKVAKLGFIDLINTYRQPVPIKLGSTLGGFETLNNSRLDMAKARFETMTGDQLTGPVGLPQSNYQTSYIRKIYGLVESQGATLVLLNAPVPYGRTITMILGGWQNRSRDVIYLMR